MSNAYKFGNAIEARVYNNMNGDEGKHNLKSPLCSTPYKLDTEYILRNSHFHSVSNATNLAMPEALAYDHMNGDEGKHNLKSPLCSTPYKLDTEYILRNSHFHSVSNATNLAMPEALAYNHMNGDEGKHN